MKYLEVIKMEEDLKRYQDADGQYFLTANPELAHGDFVCFHGKDWVKTDGAMKAEGVVIDKINEGKRVYTFYIGHFVPLV